jgi:BirA family transcriptional regulator, biotin operon repressor / biotin---[acetyl-CoA-carboxylase] ligase
MIDYDIRGLGERLSTIESIAVIPRVESTLELGKRVLAECVENELPIPSSVIIAREQMKGRGRGDRTWYSPAERGFYATLTITVERETAALLPLALAVVTASFLRDTYLVDAGVKWPNDILIDGRKVAGLLIFARHHEDHVYVAAGIGINVRQESDGMPEGAISLEEAADASIEIDRVIVEFVEYFDQHLDPTRSTGSVLEEWREMTVHREGDRIRCLVGDDMITGSWKGIDDRGHALVDRDGRIESIAAGDVIEWK